MKSKVTRGYCLWEGWRKRNSWACYTEDGRDVYFNARRAARDRCHREVDTQHLLWGILQNKDSIACKILDHLGTSVEKLQQEVGSILGPRFHYTTRKETVFLGLKFVTFPEEPKCRPITMGYCTKFVLTLAAHEASHLDCRLVDSGHVLIGLVAEEYGMAASIMRDSKVDLGRVRDGYRTQRIEETEK